MGGGGLNRFYRPFCVEPVRKPHCWFSHDVARFTLTYTYKRERDGVVVEHRSLHREVLGSIPTDGTVLCH